VTASGGGASGAATNSDPTLIGDNPPDAGQMVAISEGGVTKYQFTYTDLDGYADLDHMQVMFNSLRSSQNSCWVIADTAGNLYLADSGGALTGPITAGGPGAPLSNSQCSVNPGGSSVTVLGNTATVKLAVTFTSLYAAPQIVYSEVDDAAGIDTGWKPAGAIQAPVISSISGTAGVSGSVTINGSNFGASQNEATVNIGGVGATITSWSSTQIIATVPAVSGNVYAIVTVGGVPSAPYALSLDFTLTISPALQTVSSGGDATYAITANPTSGFNQPINLIYHNNPSIPATGVSFSNSQLTAPDWSSTLTIHGLTAVNGSYQVWVEGDAGSLLKYTQYAGLTVTTSPVFTLTASALSQQTQTTATIPVNVTSSNGFSSTLRLAPAAGQCVTGSPSTVGLGMAYLAVTTSACQAGNHNVVITGTSTADSNITNSATVVVRTDGPSLTIEDGPDPNNPSNLPDATTGQPYSYQFKADYGTGSYSWSASGVPQDLAVSSAGQLSGTPSQTRPGTYSFTVFVNDTQNSANHTYNLNVIGPLTITTANVTCPFKTSCNQTLAATGGSPPYTWSISAGSLPAGLSLSSSGAITGTATVGSTFTFVARVTDSQSRTVTQSLTISVPNFIISVRNEETIHVGASSSAAVTVNGAGLSSPVELSISGLPTDGSITANFSPSSLTSLPATAVLTLTAAGTAATVDYPGLMLTIKGSVIGFDTTTPMNLIVQNAGLIPTHSSLASPARLETNLGPMQFDVYDETNCEPGHEPGTALGCDTHIRYRYVNACSHWLKVRQCYQNALNFYAQNQVTGVRFQFAFCGGAHSTPLLNCGTPASTAIEPSTGPWHRQVDEFFEDVQASGINNITITTVYAGFGGDTVIGYPNGAPYTPTGGDPPGQGCSTDSANMQWWPALPFGLMVTAEGPRPYLNSFNDSYNCAPANPYFIGWNNIYNAIGDILKAAQFRSLIVEEFDMSNEVTFADNTVWARLIVDNTHGNEHVFDKVRCLVATNGQGTDCGFKQPSQRVTFSVQDGGATPDPRGDCLSVYRDSARVLPLSELTAAIAGGLIGLPLNFTFDAPQARRLKCLGSISSETPDDHGNTVMLQLPYSWVSQPTIVDMHTSPCLADESGACILTQSQDQASKETQTTMDAAKIFLDSFCPTGLRANSPQLCGALFMLGETDMFQALPFLQEYPSRSQQFWEQTCVNSPVVVPCGTVDGFNLSTLKTHIGGVVIRPWLSATNPAEDPTLKEDPGDPNSLPLAHVCFGFPQTLAPTFRTNQ